MAKQSLPGQHSLLEQVWPSDCCLCTHEATIAALELQLTEVREWRDLEPSRRLFGDLNRILKETK